MKATSDFVDVDFIKDKVNLIIQCFNINSCQLIKAAEWPHLEKGFL